MLQVVRDDGRAQWQWPRPPEGENSDLMGAAAGSFADRYRRSKRRSAVGRIGLAVLIALTFVIAGLLTQFAASNGSLDALLGRTPVTAAVAVPAEPPVAAAAPAAPAIATAPPEAAPRPPMPEVRALMILIRNSIVALHQANTTGNYAVLRETAAPGFQQANSPANLGQAFAELRGRAIDLGQIAVVSPLLTQGPAIDDKGLLSLAGVFPVGADQVDFDLAFQMIDGRWRLFGIGAQPPPAPADAAPAKPAMPKAAKPALPDVPTMVALIRGAIIALNQANIAGDYVVLRDLGARGFRDTNSPAQLSTIFAELRTRQLDLSPVAVIDPQLIRAAAIDAQGYLRLTGFFPSRPERVNFDLAFAFEDGQWRVFGIALNTSREEVAQSAAPGEAAPAPPAAAPAAPAAADIPLPTPHPRP